MEGLIQGRAYFRNYTVLVHRLTLCYVMKKTEKNKVCRLFKLMGTFSFFSRFKVVLMLRARSPTLFLFSKSVIRIKERRKNKFLVKASQDLAAVVIYKREQPFSRHTTSSSHLFLMVVPMKTVVCCKPV